MTGSAASTADGAHRSGGQVASPRYRRRTARVVALIAVAAAAALLLVPTSGTVARAAVPGSTGTVTGRATHYSLGSGGGGNCSFPAELLRDRMYTAAGPDLYAKAGGCGAYVEVTGPSGTVRVIIADQCPKCGPGHLDLSEEAFSAIGPFAAGVIPISYRIVRDPALPGPLEVRVKEGSSQWWIGFLIMNHGNPLTSVEYRDSSGTWRALARQPYNYWLASSGAGPGPFTLRITDAAGHRAVVGNIALSPSVTQRTSVRMYGSSVGEPPVTGAPTAAPAPAPAPTGPPASTAPPAPTTTPTRTVTATATAPGTPSDPGTPGTCRATVAIGASWPGGYLATVSVRNTGPARNPWQVSWTLPAGASLVNGWNAAVTQQGQQVTARAPSWNPNLPTGGSIAVGFLVSGPSTPLPEAVRLGTTTCEA